MDPLSDVLSLLKPRSQMSAGFDAGGDWAVRFADMRDRIKCYVVLRGGCWLAVEGAPAVRLEAGDCFVLPSGRPFLLGSDLSRPPVDSTAVFPPAHPGGVVTHNGGGGVFLAGSRFSVSGVPAGMLLRLMPPVIHVTGEAEQAALRWSVERMMQELREPQPGSHLISRHLAHMMLIQALRLHLARAPDGGTGWLPALADGQVGAALAAMHEEPARRWTLRDLAGRAGMSRSAFAARFKGMVGVPPLAYLTRWRMLLGADRMEGSADPLSAIALSLGYESESAFSTAFKRVMGVSPRQFDRSRTPGPPA